MAFWPMHSTAFFECPEHLDTCILITFFAEKKMVSDRLSKMKFFSNLFTELCVLVLWSNIFV